MAKTKKMDEADFAKMVKEITAVAEMIRTHQDEKQSVLDDFEKEKKRYLSGKISKKAFNSSVKKVNKELSKLDSGIRSGIKKAEVLARRISGFSERQRPKMYSVKLTGINLRTAGKKKPKKKAAKKTRKKAKKKPKKKPKKKVPARATRKIKKKPKKKAPAKTKKKTISRNKAKKKPKKKAKKKARKKKRK